MLVFGKRRGLLVPEIRDSPSHLDETNLCSLWLNNNKIDSKIIKDLEVFEQSLLLQYTNNVINHGRHLFTNVKGDKPDRFIRSCEHRRQT